MNLFYGFLMGIHILASFVLIIVVLLQAGKGGGMAGLFGGGAESLFGGQGTGKPMAIATGICASLFIITCLSLSFLSRSTQIRSVTNTGLPQQQMPATPTPQTPVPQSPANK